MKDNLNKLIHVIDEFRMLHPDIQSQAMLSFIYIAMWSELDEPVYIKDVAEAVGVPSATASRNVTLLTKGTYRLNGLGLVTTHEDPLYRTRKIIKLTSVGKKLANRLRERMDQ